MKFKFQYSYLESCVSSMKNLYKYLYNILDFASWFVKSKIFTVWLYTEKFADTCSKQLSYLKEDFLNAPFILLLHCLKFIKWLYFVLKIKTRTFNMDKRPCMM